MIPRQNRRTRQHQETKASNIISCHTNRMDKIILNIVGVAKKTRLISLMIRSTQEKSYWETTLRYSCPQIELSLEITEKFQKTIHDARNFLKLLLIMHNLFEHLSNFQKGYEEHLPADKFPNKIAI